MNQTNLFLDEVMMHLSETCVGAAVHRPTVNVVTETLVLENKQAHVTRRT